MVLYGQRRDMTVSAGLTARHSCKAQGDLCIHFRPLSSNQMISPLHSTPEKNIMALKGEVIQLTDSHSMDSVNKRMETPHSKKGFHFYLSNLGS